MTEKEERLDCLGKQRAIGLEIVGKRVAREWIFLQNFGNPSENYTEVTIKHFMYLHMYAH